MYMIIYDMLTENTVCEIFDLALAAQLSMDDSGLHWDSLTSSSGLSLLCLPDLITHRLSSAGQMQSISLFIHTG